MMPWRFTAALGCFLSLGITGAAAADPALSDFALRDSISAYDWSGSYVGGFVGYGSGMSANSWSPTSVGPWLPDGDISYASLTGGLYAGYQQQFGNFVVGGEADLGFGQMRGDDSQAGGFVNQIEIGTIGTLRGRLGFAADNFMVFATGGAAIGDLYKRDLTNQFSGRNFAAGWTIGGGVEMALTGNLRARAEYQYVRFAPVETGIVAAGGGGYMHRADDPSIHMLRAGLSYAF
jgi:outer membrane immunogenic protein